MRPHRFLGDDLVPEVELRTWLVAAATFVAAVLVLDSTGIVSPWTEMAIDNGAQLFGGIAASVLCAVTARHTAGVERTWRWLMAVGMGGWSIGQVFWSWYQLFSDTPLPSPSVADVGYLTMPVFALPALLAFAVPATRQVAETSTHHKTIFALDAAIVVGALFALTWATALGAVVHAESPSLPAFVVAIAYPLTDLVLVSIVVLLVATHRAPRRLRPQLVLLGLGLVGISASDSIFAYLVSTGAEEMPPLTNAGFIAGPLLIAIAGVTTAADHPTPRHARHRTMDRARLMLPYVLVAVTGSVAAARNALGKIDAVETALTWSVLLLVLVRQVITLLENAVLLDRLKASQAVLSHQAYHDSLTGLANRTLFGDRLQKALERQRRSGPGFAVLVIDLDDFKAVNDALGHAAGDLVLYAVAQRLRGCVRSADTVARLGGDEFAVILDDEPEAAGRVAERILLALRHPFHVIGQSVVQTASVGVVTAPWGDPHVTPDILVSWADRAMYAGKRRGKATAVHYGPDLARDAAPYRWTAGAPAWAEGPGGGGSRRSPPAWVDPAPPVDPPASESAARPTPPPPSRSSASART